MDSLKGKKCTSGATRRSEGVSSEILMNDPFLYHGKYKLDDDEQVLVESRDSNQQWGGVPVVPERSDCQVY